MSGLSGSPLILNLVILILSALPRQAKSLHTDMIPRQLH